MKTTTKPTYVPREIEKACCLVRHRQFGLDRVIIWLDAADPVLPVKDIASNCGKATLRPQAMKYQPMWRSQLDLRQPGLQALGDLLRAVGQRHRLQITYVELACDFITRDEDQAHALHHFLREHVDVPGWRQKVRSYMGTTYWGSRSLLGDDDNEAESNSVSRRGRNLVLYSDRPSKLVGRWKGRSCMHLESRLTGARIIAKAGIGSLQDLIAFKHRAYWNSAIRLSRFGSRAALGTWLEPKSSASKSWMRRQAAEFIEDYRLDGSFILQNAVLDDRAIMKILVPIPMHLLLVGER